ncbi:replication initiation factor domain-containing protein [Terasakiella sp. SH-1]|uniref:replication initiation factor domain-containing protein n=1 Tax=Terasakiella sp. SH-1 TaxID=2560057 RepID=UPI001073E8B0|nr:replication initiation factor domain-containing protein [Terasakiella sp. SH-1]
MSANALNQSFQADYATLLAQGVDTLIETFDIGITDYIWEWLEGMQEEAKGKCKRGKGLTPFEICGETFQMQGKGGGGAVFVMLNNHFMIKIRSRDMDGWILTIEYRSAALWEFTPDSLRAKAQKIARFLGIPKGTDWIRMSSIHWAFDFHSEELTNEISAAMHDQFVCLSRVKNGTRGKMTELPNNISELQWSAFGSGGRTETLTVGTLKSLQVQIYDKGREIRENSKKTWMLDLWNRNEYGLVLDSFDHIWRVELRFNGKGYLKRRGIQTYEQFMENKDALLKDCLERRRLAQPTNDTNRSRWPNHPLWDECWDAAGESYWPIPLKVQVHGRKTELSDQMKRNAAGTLRSLVVLETQDYDFQAKTLNELVKETVEMIWSDPEHKRKIDLAFERYRYVNDAE